MKSISPQHIQQYHRALLEGMKSRCYCSSAILDAFARVPRHLFVTQYYERLSPSLRQLQTLAHMDDVNVFYRTVYTDQALVTQINDTNEPISSSSQPSVMAFMLQLLDLSAGQRVLEIGTGTGYNAALLAVLVHDPMLVTTIDLDETLVQHAREVVEHVVGSGMVLRTGNGLLRVAKDASFDRVIATGSVDTIPLIWLQQLHPGGVLVVNLRGLLAGGFLRLVKEDGAFTATGKMFAYEGVSFMALQDGKQEHISLRMASQTLTRAPIQETAFVTPDFFPIAILKNMHFLFFLQNTFPHLERFWFTHAPGETVPSPRLLDHDSQTLISFEPDVESESWHVEVRGKIPLWTRVYDCYTVWSAAGRPTINQYGVSIDEEGRQKLTIHQETKGHPAQKEDM